MKQAWRKVLFTDWDSSSGRWPSPYVMMQRLQQLDACANALVGDARVAWRDAMQLDGFGEGDRRWLPEGKEISAFVLSAHSSCGLVSSPEVDILKYQNSFRSIDDACLLFLIGRGFAQQLRRKTCEDGVLDLAICDRVVHSQLCQGFLFEFGRALTADPYLRSRVIASLKKALSALPIVAEEEEQQLNWLKRARLSYAFEPITHSVSLRTPCVSLLHNLAPYLGRGIGSCLQKLWNPEDCETLFSLTPQYEVLEQARAWILAAPDAFDAQGRWNGSPYAPRLLTAVWSAMSEQLEANGDERVEEILDAWFQEFLSAVLKRPDGRPLIVNWLILLQRSGNRTVHARRTTKLVFDTAAGLGVCPKDVLSQPADTHILAPDSPYNKPRTDVTELKHRIGAASSLMLHAGQEKLENLDLLWNSVLKALASGDLSAPYTAPWVLSCIADLGFRTDKSECDIANLLLAQKDPSVAFSDAWSKLASQRVFINVESGRKSEPSKYVLCRLAFLVLDAFVAANVHPAFWQQLWCDTVRVCRQQDGLSGTRLSGEWRWMSIGLLEMASTHRTDMEEVADLVAELIENCRDEAVAISASTAFYSWRWHHQSVHDAYSTVSARRRIRRLLSPSQGQELADELQKKAALLIGMLAESYPTS